MSDPMMPIGHAPPETVLPPIEAAEADALEAVATLLPEEQRTALYDIAAHWPRSPAAWAALCNLEGPLMERYAFARVGYHRGLDALRAAGWRGSGYVRSREQGNLGFLHCLDVLRTCATAIGELDEAERCRLFLRQLDPDWRMPD